MANGDTIMKYIVPVIGAIVVALQGVNLHNTGEAANESRQAEQEASSELKAIRKVQDGITESTKRQELILGKIHENQESATKQLNQIKEKLGVPITPILPSPTPQ